MSKKHTIIFITAVYGFVLFAGQFTYAAYIATAPGEYKIGSLAEGEMHTYSFTASADDSVTILMSQSSHVYDYGEGFEPYLELHAPDGTVLAVNSGADAATIQSVRVPRNGTCLILAREKDGFDAGDYGLSLVKIPGTVTVNDPNGGPINSGEYKKGRIEPGDMDAYTFTASAGDSITILMSQSSQIYDYGEIFEPRVELYAPDGTVVDVNSGSDSAMIHSDRVPQSGTCFIIAREKDGSDVGDYCLSLLKVPGTANCGTIDPGEYTRGRIEPGEIDAYAFTASAGDSITILTSQIGDQYGETFEPRVELHAPDGTVLAINSGSDSATIQSVKGPQSGTYLIAVMDLDGLDAWDYGLSLSGNITPGTPGDLNEVSSTEATLVETIYIEQAMLSNGQVVGDLNGVFVLNDFELVTIGTGLWTGKGFSRAICEATFEGATYMGEWQCIAFFDPNTSEISLKGSIIGEILATVEGTMIESIPGSGIYDRYQATWKIGRLDSTITSATVSVSGILTDNSIVEYPSTDLYLLQTAMDGNLAGDLSGPLSTVVNHVRIADRKNPYNGSGFSVISYVCQSGSGEGYTCDELTSPGVLTMRGMFTDPLFGVLSATLNEPTTPRGTTTPRALHLSLQRVDLGLPPMADLEVEISGPSRVSPGQTIDLIIEYRNIGVKSAENVIVVHELSGVTDYESSTHNGMYRWQKHEVFWNIGTVEPGDVGFLASKVTLPWGLPSGTPLWNIALFGTTSLELHSYLNPEDSLVDVNDYLAYEPVKVLSTKILSEEEIADLLLNNKVQSLFEYAVQLGFQWTGSAFESTLNKGRITRIVLIKADFPELLFVTIANETVLLEIFGDASYSVMDDTGGFVYDIASGGFDYSGAWQQTGSCGFGRCFTNCLIEKLPLHLIAKEIETIKHILGTVNCWNCVSSGFNDDIACLKCGKELATIAGEEVPFLGEAILLVECYGDCGLDPTSHCCEVGSIKKYCSKASWVYGWIANESSYTRECGWPGMWSLPTEMPCVGDICEDGECISPHEKCESGFCDPYGPVVSTARDPNRKMGPQGNVGAGQKLDYKVEYENEGEGIAFGVYFTDTLDEDVDDSTLEIGPVIDVDTGLQIAPPGIYIPATRTIIWFVGQVDPNQGGYADFSVSVKPDAANGTEIINFSTVYFPSVPEATRTNAIVSIVSTVSPNHPPVVNAGPDVTVNEGQLLSRVGSFVDNDVDDSWSAMVDYGDGSGRQPLDLDGKTYTLSHTYEKSGVFEVTVTVTDSRGDSGVGRFVVTVNKVAPAVSVNIVSQDVQYSDSIDEVIFTATSISADAMNASVSYSTDGGSTFSTIMTSPPTLAVPDDRTVAGGLALNGDIVQVGTGTWTLAGVADLAPGLYIIRLTVSDEDDTSASIDTTINVLKEDAFATYVGAENVSTPSAADSVATVELMAVILDTVAVNPASDSDVGNITKASVTFVNRDSGEVIAEGIHVILLEPGDLTAGLARYEWVVDIGSQNSASFTVGIIVNGYYTRDHSADNAVVTVSRSVEGFIAGGE